MVGLSDAAVCRVEAAGAVQRDRSDCQHWRSGGTVYRCEPAECGGDDLLLRRTVVDGADGEEGYQQHRWL